MRRVRFTIGGLMALVIVAGVGFAALRSPTKLWDSVLFSTILVVLGTATLGAFHFRGRTRASWAGFAAFGFVYLAITSGPWSAPILPRLITTELLDQFDALLRPRTGTMGMTFAATGSPPGTATFTMRGSGSTTIQAQNFQIWTTVGQPLKLDFLYFVPIGQNLWTLIVAILGGMIGGSLFGFAERKREDEARTDHLRRSDSPSLSLSGELSKLLDPKASSDLSG